jgi:hemerythrin superfamily protein
MTAKATGSSASRSTSKAGQDAITLLTDDHKKVKKMFKDFDKAAEAEDIQQKEELVEQICLALMVHTEIEEEIFYPAVRAAIDDDDMLNEAEVEHASAKDLIAQIQAMASSDPLYDAKVTVLGEYIDHHVKEEEAEMFTKAKKAKLDLDALGEQMSDRKEELMTTMDGKTPPAAARGKSAARSHSPAR